MKTRGFGPFKEQWYSICSKHKIHDDECNMCQAGTWSNIYRVELSNRFFNKFPNLWVRWANRK